MNEQQVLKSILARFANASVQIQESVTTDTESVLLLRVGKQTVAFRFRIEDGTVTGISDAVRQRSTYDPIDDEMKPLSLTEFEHELALSAHDFADDHRHMEMKQTWREWLNGFLRWQSW